jgi:hypothetical protein
MPYPSDGGGGGLSPSTPLEPSQIPNLYNPNKTVRYTYDFMSITPITPFAGGVFNSGTFTLIGYESENRVCVWDVNSSTTANSGAHCGILQTGCPHSAKPIITVHFKTPSAIDANSVIQIGTYSNTGTDRSAIEISGSSAQVKNVVGGTATDSGGTYTVAANTWYIARVKYNSDSSAVFSLYSENGALLYTHTVNVALFNGALLGIKTFNTGTVAKSLARFDFIELSFPVNNRYYLE